MLTKCIIIPTHVRSLCQVFILTISVSLLSVSDSNSQATAVFTSSDLSGAVITNPTSLQFGPDGRLYVSQQKGEIKAFTINRTGANSYAAVATETILLVKNIPNHNDDGSLNAAITERQITGLLVTGTASNPVLYVSSSDVRIGAGGSGTDKNLDTNSGVISKLTWNGTSWNKIDVVTGLPRSEENHASNGLQLDEVNNILYLAQGGNTNAGSSSNNFAFLCEYALGGAILKIDLSKIETDFAGSYKLPTLDDPTRSNTGPGGSDANDPFGGNDGLNQAKLVIGGPVQIHSPGHRNPYDLVITKTPGKEGRMYSVDNGANGGWGGYPDQEGASGNPLTTSVTNKYVIGEPGSSAAGLNDAKVNNLDNLHLISKPGMAPIYAGHPNPIRANPSGAGWYWFNNTTNTATYNLNPTVDWPPVPLSQANPVEADFRNPGVNDGALYTWKSSTNGITEYTSNKFFAGNMVGDLLVASFDGGIYRIKLEEDGTAVNFVETLAASFSSIPLDVTAQGTDDVFEGSVWVANYGSGTITIFEPVSGCEGFIDVTVTRSGNTLTAKATDATYQWIDCSNNTNIVGETGQSFIAPSTGSYAVRITKGECIDISSCINMAEAEPSFTLRINAGGGLQIYGSETWEADQFYSADSKSFATTEPISNTEKDNLYQTERFTKNFSYEIPVPRPGEYRLTLHFAEIYWTETGKRLFNVDIESGQGSLANYDIIAAAGLPNAATTESFTVVVTDGALSMNFTTVLDNAKISAIELILPPDPTITSFTTSQATICAGSSTTLVVNGSLGSATAWHLYTGSCGGTLVTSNTTGIFQVSPTTNTSYYVRGEGGFSVPGTCAKLDIQVKTIVVSVTLSGKTLIATPSGAAYQWINCNGNTNIAGETGRFFTAEEIGSYAVKVTENGCTSTSACVDVVVVGLTDDDPDEITVHPNPAQYIVIVKLPDPQDKYFIKISDTQGREVLSTYSNNTSELDLNIETLAKGIYFIQIRSDKLMKTVKLIIN
jgi:Malectin domain/Secretion system C-terminal sorting domain